MISTPCALVLSLALAGQVGAIEGEMRGSVVNASRGGAPSAGTDVMLRLQMDGQLVPVAQTTTNVRGEFQFTGLPVGDQYVYLPGANHQGIHYPGRRLRVSAACPEANVRLEVCDSISEPNPLVIRRHDISILTEPGVLRITESLLVENPTPATFVGRPQGQENEPTTMQLSIPSDFDRTTFHQEFYGRRFSLVGGKLVTHIPWTPGQRELKFTYTLGNDETCRLWQRPLDLPCQLVRVRVAHSLPKEVSSNLPAAPDTGSEEGTLVFQSTGKTLPAGHLIRVQLGQLPLPWMTYARWGALILLASLILLGFLAIRHRPRCDAPEKNISPRVHKMPKGARKSDSRRSGQASRRRMAS